MHDSVKGWGTYDGHTLPAKPTKGGKHVPKTPKPHSTVKGDGPGWGMGPGALADFPRWKAGRERARDREREHTPHALQKREKREQGRERDRDGKTGGREGERGRGLANSCGGSGLKGVARVA